ncbi:hypothetical protein AK812_SmicGene37405 [Symbiodinium microadriaticum]|uniref:RAP domain-containing protein n=1 Tax=Symbiodinium microadriaticum TaxID=2951 RepID=A0A1Q9CGD9_SYMMI|nr:hypothetical protein AK812_SmicGene37405 [Symbiodinium microadriaticum]
MIRAHSHHCLACLVHECKRSLLRAPSRHITVIPLDSSKPDAPKLETRVLQRWAEQTQHPDHATAMLRQLPTTDSTDVYTSRSGFLRCLRALHWLHVAGAPAEELLESWRLLENIGHDEARSFLPCDLAEIFSLLASCERSSTELVRHLNIQCRTLSRSFAAEEIAQVMRACGKLSFRPVQTFRKLGNKFGALLQDPDGNGVKGSQIACVAATHALLQISWQSRKQERDLQMWKAMAVALPRHLPDMKSRDIAVTLNAFAKFDFSSSSIHGNVSRMFSTVATRLVPLVALSEFPPRELALVSNAFAKIRAGPWAMPLLKTISACATPQLQSYNEQDFSNTLNAFAQLRCRDPMFFDAVSLAVAPKIASFDPQGLSLVAHAYAKLQFRHDSLFEKIADASMRLMDRFKPLHLGNLAYAFGRLQIQNKQLNLCLADEVVFRGTIGKTLQDSSDLYRFPLSPLERLTQAFARLSISDQRLYFVLFDMTRQRVRELTCHEENGETELLNSPDKTGAIAPTALSGHGLSILLSAFAKSQSNFHSLMRWVPKQVTGLQGQYSTHQLCTIFNSCSKLGIVNSPMYTDLISFAKLRVPQMSPRSLAMLLRGMARAKTSNRQVIRSAVKVISAKLVELDVVDACALFVGCAEMNYRDARFLRLLAAVVRSRLGEVSGSQLATALACYAHMRVRHLAWFDAILFELFKRQHELTEKDASNIAYAMLLLATVERHEHELQRAPQAGTGTHGYPFDTHHGVLYSMLAISNEHRNELNYPAVYQLQIVELYLRLLEPGVYDAMRQELKTLLAKARKVNVVVDDYMQNSSRLHRRISQWFTRVGLHHRSEVFLGPFMLDMVIGNRVVVEIDGPSHFYRDTNTRTASSLLKHNLLKAMGFHVRHLPYQEWQQCGTAVKRTMYCSAFWKDVLAASEDEIKAEAPNRGPIAEGADPRVPELIDILDLVLNWQSGQGPHPSIALLGKKLEPKRPQQSLPAFYETEPPEIDDVAVSRLKFDVDAERQQARSEQELLAAHAEAEAALEDDRQQSISSIQRVRLDSRKKLEEGHETNVMQDLHDIMPRSRRKVIRHTSSGLFDQDALEENTDDSSDEEPEGDSLEFQLAEEKEPEQQADKEHYERVQILPDQTRDTGSSDGLAKE